jgi:hypothetical protein
MPFFVGSQPTARAFPWGALSFAALIFFGVGAAVAFGAVSALRASRDVVVRERTVLEAPAPAVSPAEVRAVAPAPAPVAEPPVVAAPAAPSVVRAPSAAVVPSKTVETRTEPARRAPRRAPKAAKPRPLPVRPASSERSKEATPGKETAPTKGDALPFTSQPY